MNFKHIHYVLTIAQEGSITAASKKLYVTQPALSQTVKLIERDLGAPIFDRNTDPISLTFEGQKYVEAAQKMVDIERSLQAEVVRAKKDVRGRMCVGISMQRGIQLLPHVIPEFKLQYPRVKVDLIEHGSATLEKMICQGQCDMALITTGRQPHTLEYLSLETEKVVLMAANSTELAQRIPDGTPISISEAADEQFVCMAQGHSIRAIQDRLFDAHCFSADILLETKNMEAAKEVTAYSNAVMLIPDVYLKKPDHLREYIHIYPIKDNVYERHFCLCYRKGMEMARYMKDFIRIVCTELSVPVVPEREG